MMASHPGRRQGSAEFGEFTELVVNPHVPIEPPDSFTLGLGQTDGQHSQSFNRRYRRSRHLWQERFACSSLDRSHLLTRLA